MFVALAYEPCKKISTESQNSFSKVALMEL